MRRSLTALAALSAVLVVAGCSATPQQSTGDAPASGVSSEDLSGREVTLDAPAAAVVCLDGTCIDALAELGLEPVASVQIAQVRHPGFFGADAKTVELGGTFFEPDLEGILAADPDLVIGSSNVHGGLEEALGGVPFYGNAVATPQDAVTNLEHIATLTGREKEAKVAIERYEQTLAAYQPEKRPVSVLSMYGGATNDIGIDALDSSIGATLAPYTSYPWPQAAAGDSGFLEIGVDDILDVDPEHIWILDFGFDPGAPALTEQLAKDPVWQNLTAVKNGNVHVADQRWWSTTGGTRGQQLVLDTVLTTLYPTEFPAPLSGLTP